MHVYHEIHNNVVISRQICMSGMAMSITPDMHVHRDIAHTKRPFHVQLKSAMLHTDPQFAIMASYDFI